MSFELSVFQNEGDVDQHAKDKGALGVSLELEFRVKVKLSDQESSEDVLGKYLNNTPLNVDVNSVSEN